jgi:hypothetical protein
MFLFILSCFASAPENKKETIFSLPPLFFPFFRHIACVIELPRTVLYMVSFVILCFSFGGAPPKKRITGRRVKEIELFGSIQTHMKGSVAIITIEVIDSC